MSILGSFEYTRKNVERLEPFEEGQVVVLTAGSYSDYGYLGVAKVLKGFKAVDFLKVPKALGYSAHIDFARLEREGYLETIPSRELHDHAW